MESDILIDESNILIDESNMVIIKMHVHDYLTSKEISLEMEKAQIIDAYHINPQESKWENIGINYYTETYGSKVSDDHIVDTNEMVEISDEEIEKASRQINYGGGSEGWIKDAFRKGAKWMREELNKQV